jgi:hypothetical protein
MKERISEILNKGNTKSILSAWESRFLESLLNQAENKKNLSLKQNSWLQRIENKVADAFDDSWDKEWDAEKQENLRIVYEYYSRDYVYFANILDWVKNHPGDVLPKPYYKKMCENKYAKKIIKAIKSPPVFVAGDHVSLRSTARNIRRASPPYRKFNPEKDDLFFVLAPLDKAINAVKGARLYKVLCATESIPIEVEERHLKKYRKKVKKVIDN